MMRYVRAFALGLVAAGLCFAQGGEALAGCVGLSGTADGFDKATAVTRAQSSLTEAVAQLKAQKRVSSVSVTAMRAQPQPYWRSSVSPELYFKPDIVTANSYTICWSGVVSPYVCTSGAKVCW